MSRGLVDFLSGKVSRADISVQHDRSSGNRVHSCRQVIAENGWRPKHLQGAILEALFRALLTEYDLVILDTAPVLAVSDTKIVGHLADRIILAARWNATDVAAVTEAVRLLSSLDERLVGSSRLCRDMRKYKQYSSGEAGTYYKLYRNYYTE